MFFARRYRTVVSVPWSEWAGLRGSEEKKVYVAAKLRTVGINVPASAQQLPLTGAAAQY